MKIKYLKDCECSPIDGASISLPLRFREHDRRKIEKKCEGKRMGNMSVKCCPLDIALLLYIQTHSNCSYVNRIKTVKIFNMEGREIPRFHPCQRTYWQLMSAKGVATIRFPIPWWMTIDPHTY